jgi:nucleoside-diphosphate-sugar epimerase
MACKLRVSTGEVKKKRRARDSRIFITGATGFLGSHIAACLLEQGYRLTLLVRPKKQLSPEDRITRLLDWFGVSAGLRKNVRVVRGRVDEPGLGLDGQASADLVENIDEVIHCASDTSFSERKRASVEGANVSGLRYVLDLAERSGCFFVHLVSTAYVAGRVSGSCPEALVKPPEFTNVYEETKCRGEWIAWERCRETGMRLSIFRPSIVYGHSETGRSLLFNALYYPVRTALFLKNLYEADIKERGGRKAAEMGIRIESDGGTYMPLRMEVNGSGGINLVPVDFFVRAFAAIMEEAHEGGIFHIVNNRLNRIEDIIAYTKRLFRIRGIEACAAADFVDAPRNSLESLFETYLEAYGPYIRDLRMFETEKSGPILAGKNISCPDFNYEIYSRVMTYAVEAGWGAKLFQEQVRNGTESA